MGNTLLGKIVYYWIFLIGGLVVAKLFGMPMDATAVIVFLIILTCFYWGFAFLKSAGKRKRGEKDD